MSEKKSFDRVLLLHEKSDKQTSARPILAGIKGDRFYYGCSHGYTDWDPESYEVVREFDYKTDLDLTKIYREFDNLRTPDPQAPCARLGWVSPEGYFFPCAYCAHQDLASLLVKRYLPDQSSYLGGADILEKAGWLALKGGFAYRDSDDAWPAPMLETFGKIVLAFQSAKEHGENFNRSLLQNPEGYFVQSYMTPPDDRGDIVDKLLDTYLRACGEKKDEVVSLLPPLNGFPSRPSDHPGD